MLLAMMLTVLALVVGYLVLGVSDALFYAVWLGDRNPSDGSFWAIAALCGFGFATLSGWLTALVAQRRPIAHTCALVAVIAISWGLYTSTDASLQEPLWVLLLNLGIGATGIMSGGWIYLKQSKKQIKYQSKQYSGVS